MRCSVSGSKAIRRHHPVFIDSRFEVDAFEGTAQHPVAFLSKTMEGLNRSFEIRIKAVPQS